MVTITTSTGLGSGVIVNAAGVVVTNLHVIRGEASASVKLANGDVYDDISVIDVDERKDLVLLKLKAFGLTAVSIGNSDQVRVGDHVVLIGSPRGLDLSVTDGLISAARDSGDGYRLFQTSAAASPGSSGGGMFNEFGELIGIVSAKVTNGENINFAIPANYVRGLLATQGQMTLAALAEKFPASPSGDAQGNAPGKVDSVAANKFASIVSTSTLQWIKDGSSSWHTAFAGQHAATVTVYASLVGDLVVSQSIIAESPTLTADQMSALLKFNFAADLVKASIEGKRLVALNETELRLLDGPGLKRVVENVAAGADKAAGMLDDGMTSVPLLQGHALLRYSAIQFKSIPADNEGSLQFTSAAGDLYVKVIAERIEIPLDRMPDVILANARKVAPDARIFRQEYRTVNGLRMLVVEFEGSASGIAFSFYGHYYSDAGGTVQILGYTGKNLIAEYRPTIETFVSGFSIAPR